MLQTALEDSAADPYALPTALGIIARSGTMDELAHHVEP
jgi:DNA-binding phage protein